MEVVSYLIEAHIFKLIDDEIEFLLLKRSEMEIYPNIWQMVTGTMKDGEKAFETAIREITEETGFVPQKFWVVPYMNSFYSHEKDLVCMVPVFAALVNSKTEVKLSAEHSEYGWFNKENAKKLLAWEGQRRAIDVIYEYFHNEKSFLEFVRIDI
ncbi:NUDIX pyrophosphatase [Bacteroidota bacterium]